MARRSSRGTAQSDYSGPFAFGACASRTMSAAETGTGFKVRQKLERALSLAANELERLPGGLAGGDPARELDRAVLEVRSAAEPFTRGWFRVARATVELVHGALALAPYVRQLAVPGLLEAAERESRGDVTTVLRALAANARALTRALAGNGTLLAEVSATPRRSAEPPRWTRRAPSRRQRSSSWRGSTRRWWRWPGPYPRQPGAPRRELADGRLPFRMGHPTRRPCYTRHIHKQDQVVTQWRRRESNRAETP